jgi:hypothetical protein
MEGIIREEDVRLEDGYRRISTTSTVSGYGTESDRDPTAMYEGGKGPHWRWSYRKSQKIQNMTCNTYGGAS